MALAFIGTTLTPKACIGGHTWYRCSLDHKSLLLNFKALLKTKGKWSP